MIRTIVDHPVACLMALLSLVAIAIAADRLGLIACLAWLDRGNANRGNKPAYKHWRMHQ
jgi:hypothetical protein